MRKHFLRATGPLTPAALAIALAALAGPAFAQNYGSHVVTIDATTPQPVATGFIPAVATGEVMIFAEGNVQVLSEPSRFDDGWFGPNGHTRLVRAGQPIMNGLQFGALVGGFSNNIVNYRFVGRMGAFHLQPANVGQEFRVALNMSAADLAAMTGQVKVTVIYLADGWPDIAQVEITDSTPLPIATGIIAAAGDRFAVLPYGVIQTTAQVGLTEGYFGPEGLTKFNRSGQPYSEGPYGGVYGYFADPLLPFYIGDGGTWMAGAPAVGDELFLNLNLDPADLAGCDGRFVINVVRIPL